MTQHPRTDGCAVQCPTCLAKFGGMIVCPWCEVDLIPLPDADPTALAFYALVAERPRTTT